MKNRTTGIGSLPHNSIEKSVLFSLKHTLPFLPQLTYFNENMIDQALKSDIIHSHLALEFFKDALIENKITKFKIQIAGPSTCNSNALKILLTIEKFMNYFAIYGLNPIIFIDEPIFNPNSHQFQSLLLELKNQNILSGVHTCNRFEWEEISFLNLINYFSFDANLVSPPSDIKNPEKFIIGTSPYLNNINFSDYQNNFFSYSCGLAKFSEAECDQILDYLEAIK